MRTMLAVTLAAFVVQGCKSQKVIAAETELAAVKGRIATLEKRRQELTAESRKLQVERATFSQQSDEAALAKERLVAAGSVLRNEPIPDGVQLDEALRTKSPKLGALAASIVQRQLPCVDENATPEQDEFQGDCSTPQLDDSCEGVSETSTQSFRWTCQQVAASGKTPAAALCLSSAELTDAAYPVAVETLHVEGDVVRMAFERRGRLVVADWPPPSLALYTPENWAELATCRSENEHSQCVRTCDERHGRLNNGCDDWADGYQGEGGDGEDEDTEPYELRAAREAAEREEREAVEARDEVKYQECLAGCETSEDAEPEPIARVSLDYKRSPAPGLFQFDVGIDDEDGGTPAHTLLISFPALHEELAGSEGATPEEDTVDELVTTLDVERLIEGKIVDGQRVLAGLTLQGTPVAARISMDGTKAPVLLELDEVCAFADDAKSTPLQQRCVVAKTQRDEAKAKAAAAAAKAAARDAGTVTVTAAAADAGVTP